MFGENKFANSKWYLSGIKNIMGVNTMADIMYRKIPLSLFFSSS
ncbi:hypothetical protein [Peptoniphilus harei]|nr:hypothetical protein [Peptoniphilus harei]